MFPVGNVLGNGHDLHRHDVPALIGLIVPCTGKFLPDRSRIHNSPAQSRPRAIRPAISSPVGPGPGTAVRLPTIPKSTGVSPNTSDVE